MINVTKLDRELKEAGLPVLSVISTGNIEYSRELTSAESSRAQAIVQAHDPVDMAEQRQLAARQRARLAQVLATMDGDQAIAYIENNVNDLASAKNVLKLMARMLVALRDRVFPELPDMKP